MARNKQRPITADELEQIKSFIRYDPDTGYLLDKRTGVRRGCQHPSGYRQVQVIGRNIYEHRLAWALYYNEDPYPYEIDHINSVRNDNIINNLRKATPAEQNHFKGHEQRQQASLKAAETRRATLALLNTFTFTVIT